MRRFRRGSTLALVACLFLALSAVLLGAATVCTASAHAADREYRRSEALALAEAGVAEARAGEAPHPLHALGSGSYAWSVAESGKDRLVTASGTVSSPSGVPVTRTVRARLAPAGGKGQILAWEESP